jgi:hypothetical protein
MGGDGGVIASDRRYMRGAGQADHTADSKRASKAAIAKAEREAQTQNMTTCAITGASLDYKEEIVTCPFGKLYGREAAVEALLRRKTEEAKDTKTSNTSGSRDTVDLGWQVRGLKDLHPVRFQLAKKVSNGCNLRVPVCPITSVELNGIQPAFVLVKRKNRKKDEGNDDGHPNVLSEKAMKEMGDDALQEEYGPFEKEDMIRLAPPPAMQSEIKLTLKKTRQNEKATKASKKKRKSSTSNSHESGVKRICIDSSSSGRSLKRTQLSTPVTKEARSIDDIRNNVAAAVASSSALSSLFTGTHSHLSDKEKADKLFSTNC